MVVVTGNCRYTARTRSGEFENRLDIDTGIDSDPGRIYVSEQLLRANFIPVARARATPTAREACRGRGPYGVIDEAPWGG